MVFWSKERSHVYENKRLKERLFKVPVGEGKKKISYTICVVCASILLNTEKCLVIQYQILIRSKRHQHPWASKHVTVLYLDLMLVIRCQALHIMEECRKNSTLTCGIESCYFLAIMSMDKIILKFYSRYILGLPIMCSPRSYSNQPAMASRKNIITSNK